MVLKYFLFKNNTILNYCTGWCKVCNWGFVILFNDRIRKIFLSTCETPRHWRTNCNLEKKIFFLTMDRFWRMILNKIIYNKKYYIISLHSRKITSHNISGFQCFLLMQMLKRCRSKHDLISIYCLRMKFYCLGTTSAWDQQNHWTSFADDFA